MPDKDRPSTWIRYKNGMCAQCNGDCCTMPVEIKSEDLVRLGLADPEEVRLQPKKVFKRLAREGILKSFRASTGLFMLEQRSNGDCVYLNDQRLCTVYANRPDVCRQFPNVGPRPGFCPSNKKTNGI